MKVSFSDGPFENIRQIDNHKFSRGFLGLAIGDSLTVKAFDAEGNLLETQYFEVE